MPENPPDHINASRREYQRRINRAQDYIEQHLGTPLTLAEIARAACFSPYHFHRLYTALTGEPLHAFIRRVRLERAANLLRITPSARSPTSPCIAASLPRPPSRASSVRRAAVRPANTASKLRRRARTDKNRFFSRCTRQTSPFRRP